MDIRIRPAAAGMPVRLQNAPESTPKRHILKLMLLLVAFFSATSVVAADTHALGKIEPKVANEAASLGSSEALIIFGEQADLSGAENLPTKAARGQYVYNALHEVAERTQA